MSTPEVCQSFHEDAAVSSEEKVVSSPSIFDKPSSWLIEAWFKARTFEAIHSSGRFPSTAASQRNERERAFRLRKLGTRGYAGRIMDR